MPFSVRLDPETQALIERLAKRHRQSRAWVVREAVAKYAVAEQQPRTAYDALRPLIGMVSSGDGTLSQQTGKKFTELLLKKKAERDRRRGPR
jgi:hypothetical protein